uniref:UPAR/Ly6 domain-containing protein n=1 Tax=Mola mola TaxID=94237 RepID=A0A3Q3WNA8_MOLML
SVDSLTCNQCNYGLAGYCLSNTETNCTTNTSVCSTGKLSICFPLSNKLFSAGFPSISNAGFNRLGCMEPSGCNTTINGTLMSITYEYRTDCCSTDKCNPVQLSGAPSTKMTLTAAIGAAVLASVCGSML